MKKIINVLCIGLGFLLLGIGVVGIVLPILPTTPFLLLAAVLFAKSSEKFHNWLLSTKMYQNYVGKWMKNKGMSAKEKLRVLLMITILFAIGITFAPIWHAKVFILAVLLFHYYFFIFRLKTIKDQEEEEFHNLDNKREEEEEAGV